MLLGPGQVTLLCTSVLSSSKRKFLRCVINQPRNLINSISRGSSLTLLILHMPPSIYCKCLLMLPPKYVFRIRLPHTSSIHHYYCGLSQYHLSSESMQWPLLLSPLPNSRCERACSFRAMIPLFRMLHGSASHTSTPHPSPPCLLLHGPHTLFSSHSSLLAILSTLLTWPTVSAPAAPSAQKAFALVSLCQCSHPLQGFAQISPSW